MKDEVVRVAAAETGYRVFGVGEYTSAGAWKKLYLSLNGHKFLEYSNNTTYFFHTDHLGTPRAQSNLSAAVVETWRAYPYGEQWQQSGGAGATHRYTGKERDAESANDYFGARYYWSGAGRWLGVDTVRGARGNPQSHNRYTYVEDDPINFVDHDGRLKAAPYDPSFNGPPSLAPGAIIPYYYHVTGTEYDYWVGDFYVHTPDSYPADGEPGVSGGAILAHLKKEKDDFVEKKFDENCLNWFKSTFGIDMKEVQDYAKDKMTLVNGATSEAPYAGTTVKDFLKNHPGAGFLSPYDHGTDVYYYPDRLFTDASYGADFAHEILHKKNKDWNDEYLLQRVGHQPNELSGWITKEISGHCYPKGGQ